MSEVETKIDSCIVQSRILHGDVITLFLFICFLKIFVLEEPGNPLHIFHFKTQVIKHYKFSSIVATVWMCWSCVVTQVFSKISFAHACHNLMGNHHTTFFWILAHS